MSTPTPITDAAEQTITIDCDDSCVSIYVYESDKIYEGGLVPSHASRRLELDRSALMKALFDCMGWTHRAIDLEVSGSMQIAQKGAIERAEAALATARANFPEP